MRFQRLSLFLPGVLLLSQFCQPARAHADTYQLFNLGPTNSMSFIEMSSTGLAVFQSSSNPSNFFTYFDGSKIATSAGLPSLTSDNGSNCATLPAGAVSGTAKCNNGYEAFTGAIGGPPVGLFTVAGSILTNLAPNPAISFGGAALAINSIGDIVVADGFGENWWMAVDQTTFRPLAAPEPSSMMLLATGIAAGAGLVRRKLLA